MKLTAEQTDALTELVNIGVGQAAAMLSEMLAFPIQLQVPDVKLLSLLELQSELQMRLGLEALSVVQLGFRGSFAGSAQLLFPTESAATLVSVLTGEDAIGSDLDYLKVSTLSEVGNIVVNGVMGSIGNVLNQPLDYAVPTYAEESVEKLLPQSENNASVLLAQAHFKIEELALEGNIILFFEVGSFEVLLDAIAALV